MRRIDQRLEILARAQMRIDIEEIGDPVAVITSGFLAARTLYRLVMEDRRQPDRGHSQPPDIVAPADHPPQVASPLNALSHRVEAVVQAPPPHPAPAPENA